jgi:hypothetical protein
MPAPNFSRASRVVVLLAITLFFICLIARRHIQELPPHIIEQHVIKQSNGAYRIPNDAGPSVNLVVAATSSEDYSWVKELKVPGMVVIPYIADNSSAPHHPQKNKGHEAMMYHQYFHDFYDNLPDISILIHSQARTWHVEALLDQSMIFSLNRLDLREVQRRQFLNLRVTWGFGCENGAINTTKVHEESGQVPEQKEMREAFRANFNLYDIPEILATPCCSQIAVTKERIRSVKREQYRHHIEWLLNTGLEDEISGRTWEHMWQYLFLGKAIDCPIEHKAYCRLYHICFGGREGYDEWIELLQAAHKLEKEIQKMNKEDERVKKAQEKAEEDRNAGKKADEVKMPSEAEVKIRKKTRKSLDDELRSLEEAIRVQREIAIARGSVVSNRVAEGEGMYGDEMEPGAEKHLITSKEEAKSLPTSIATIK